MGSIELFDHTADVGLRIRGESLDDLFRTAAEGLFDLIVSNRDEVEVAGVETVEVAAETTADLLIAWLDELLFRFETGHRIFGEFRVEVAGDGRSLRGEVGGEPIDRTRHILDHEIKAITRHAYLFEWGGEGWIAELILDI